jgi:hypothetical protein
MLKEGLKTRSRLDRELSANEVSHNHLIESQPGGPARVNLEHRLGIIGKHEMTEIP